MTLALLIAWFVFSVALTFWVASATGIALGSKGGAGLCTAIFLVPMGIYVALDEFVVRRIKYGPPAPGGRKRVD